MGKQKTLLVGAPIPRYLLLHIKHEAGHQTASPKATCWRLQIRIIGVEEERRIDFWPQIVWLLKKCSDKYQTGPYQRGQHRIWGYYLRTRRVSAGIRPKGRGLTSLSLLQSFVYTCSVTILLGKQKSVKHFSFLPAPNLSQQTTVWLQVIGFSFYSNATTSSQMEKKGYFDGIAGNLNLMEKFYPGWVMQLYFDLDWEQDQNSTVNPLLKGDNDFKQSWSSLSYRVSQVSWDLGWVDFDFCVPPSCPADQPLLPKSHQPKQSRAESGTLEIWVNITQSQLTWDTLWYFLQNFVTWRARTNFWISATLDDFPGHRCRMLAEFSQCSGVSSPPSTRKWMYSWAATSMLGSQPGSDSIIGSPPGAPWQLVTSTKNKWKINIFSNQQKATFHKQYVNTFFYINQKKINKKEMS